MDGWRSSPPSRSRVEAAVSFRLLGVEFADLLDAVEHHGETFTVVRRGRAIVTVSPARRTTLAGLRTFLQDHRPDEAWEKDLADNRRLASAGEDAEATRLADTLES